MRTIFTIIPIWLTLCLPSRTAAETPAAPGGGLTRVPVQVVTQEGVETKWVMIDVAGESIPEPGSLVLLVMSGLLLMRRRRN
ncbi:MAG TPA: PEP-CTERM sorting domain-containing protein [Luteolibacter sp.]|nr:PEP-CTERM sorting domain-containing protein [Luteolibacter sp.]